MFAGKNCSQRINTCLIYAFKTIILYYLFSCSKRIKLFAPTQVNNIRNIISAIQSSHSFIPEVCTEKHVTMKKRADLNAKRFRVVQTDSGEIFLFGVVE